MTPDQITRELKHLRKGRGVPADQLHLRVGPNLQALCDIQTDDGFGTWREKLASHLTEAAKRLPEDVQLAVLVGLGLHPEANQRFLEDRLVWLSERLGCATRTATRRLDEALTLLAEELVKSAGPRTAAETGEGWYVESFKALLRMDIDPPEAIEERVLVTTVDGLVELDLATSLPRHPDDVGDKHQLDAELLYGGKIQLTEQPFESLFRYVLALPEPRQAGQRHTYALKLRPPPGQLMAPHYVHVPLRRSDAFDLRIRFDLANLPRRIWRLDEVPTAVIYDRKPGPDLLTPDRFGEIYTEFRNLRQGHGYGVCWQEPY